jgi:hypothetical protein
VDIIDKMLEVRPYLFQISLKVFQDALSCYKRRKCKNLDISS